LNVADFLFKYNAIVIFVVAVSYQILVLPVVKKKLKAKFLVPIVLTLFCCILFYFNEGTLVILQRTIEFSGKSLILNELYKNLTRGRKNG